MDTVVEIEGGNSIRFTTMSAREVFIKHLVLHDVRIRRNMNKDITGIKINDYILKVGDVIPLRLFDKKVCPFKINKIKKSKRTNTYTLYSSELTKASRWIMPMLRINNETQTSMKYHSHFINCYVGTKEEGYLNNIYLVYRFDGRPEYQKFEKMLENHELFERRIEIDHHHAMYIFHMTAEMKDNFLKFQQGAYSKFSESYKRKILQFVINPAVVKEADVSKTITYGVLYKTKDQLKRIEELVGDHSVDITKEGLELLSSPYEEQEVYTGDIEIPAESSLEIARLEQEKDGEG